MNIRFFSLKVEQSGFFLQFFPWDFWVHFEEKRKMLGLHQLPKKLVAESIFLSLLLLSSLSRHHYMFQYGGCILLCNG